MSFPHASALMSALDSAETSATHAVHEFIEAYKVYVSRYDPQRASWAISYSRVPLVRADQHLEKCVHVLLKCADAMRKIVISRRHLPDADLEAAIDALREADITMADIARASALDAEKGQSD